MFLFLIGFKHLVLDLTTTLIIKTYYKTNTGDTAVVANDKIKMR